MHKITLNFCLSSAAKKNRISEWFYSSNFLSESLLVFIGCYASEYSTFGTCKNRTIKFSAY